MTTIESTPEAVVAAPSGSVDDAGTVSWLDRFIDVFTSTDHKVIGRHYFGGGLAGLLAIVVVNVLIGVERLDGADTVLDIEVIPQLLDAQRVGLVFAVMLPLAMAIAVAFVPLQVGSRSIVFPRLAFTGFWMWLGGAIITVVALVNNGGTLGGDSDMVDLFIVGLGLMAIGLLASAGSVATTILTTRAPGMTMRRVPPSTWSALVFSLGIVLVMPVFVGTLTYLFLDHRNARTGFGGNEGILTWVGWIFTQPATFLFAIPAIAMLVELFPITFGKRTPARGVMFFGLSLVGLAALAGVTQQNLQNLPWAGSQLSTSNLDEKARDLVPYLLFNALPVLGALLVLLVGLQIARPTDGMKVNVKPAVFFGFFGYGMVLVGMLGNLMYAIDDAGVQGTVFEEGSLVYVAYGAVLGAMGALVHWAPKLWGRTINSVAAIGLAFLGVAATILATFPLYIAGLLDQPAGVAYDDSNLEVWNILSLVGHGLMAITALAFVVVMLGSLLGRHDDDDVGDDPWSGQTIEWATTSPAPRDNFVDVPIIHSAEPMLDLRDAATAPTDGSAS
ncbi:MAG: cbb3-type cytochrome c oxidase subunit I [Ilumatobacteraceae bacterium]|jgi:heme/copper-type cytochrome/quinol oxidase subunit 1